MADRQLAIAGGHNFRDFGGYPTADGRTVRRGMLFRSGTLAHLQPTAAPALRALGIVTICDFRTRDEREREPTVWPDPSCQIIVDDEVVSLATLQALVVDRGSTGAQANAAMRDLYRDLPTRHAPVYRQMFRRLIEGRTPLLVHCSAGKDRTGVAAALVLSALGVPEEVVAADFIASNDALDVTRLLADSGYTEVMGNRPELVRTMLLVEPEYLVTAFAEIDARFGSVERYLEAELDVGAEDLATLRGALLV